MAKRVVLAYSGGLDTSVAVRWMTDEMGLEVVALAVDVGQGGDWDAVRERAELAGAVESIVVDAREELAEELVIPAIQANGLYEGRYPLVSSLSRPVIVKHLVEAARRSGAGAVAHGCTGKGNDQVRFEVCTRALAPDLETIAPVRSWGMTRQESIDYARRHGIPIRVTGSSPYSIDQNLWGRTIECGELEDPWASPPAEVFELTRPTTSGSEEVAIGFEEGVPVSLDGKTLGMLDIVRSLEQIFGARGFGRVDMVESRRVGIKSREVYECPAALALIMAHIDLEGMTLERDLLHEKARLEPRWAELVYDGMWYSPLMRSINAFMSSSQRHVTGEVRLVCDAGGRCSVAGRRSPVGLYDYGLATYESADTFRHSDAEGFVRLWGLGVQTASARQGRSC